MIGVLSKKVPSGIRDGLGRFVNERAEGEGERQGGIFRGMSVCGIVPEGLTGEMGADLLTECQHATGELMPVCPPNRGEFSCVLLRIGRWSGEHSDGKGQYVRGTIQGLKTKTLGLLLPHSRSVFLTCSGNGNGSLQKMAWRPPKAFDELMANLTGGN